MSSPQDVKKLSIEERLGLNKYVIDKEPHIKVKYEICKTCMEKICVYVCPAGLYVVDEQGQLHFNYEGCLECGTCRIACPHGAVEWNYPKGGKGIHYQFN